MSALRVACGGMVMLAALGAQVPPTPQSIPDPDGQIVRSEKQAFRIEVLARDLETPWALAFLPDGRLLITERPGRLRLIENGKLLPEPVKGTPAVWEKQDGGLLDVEVHPQYARNGWIYLSYSETLPGYVATGAPPDPPSMTVIVRGRINKANEWIDQQVLFRAPAAIYNSSNAHYGSRFVFDKDNHLFFSIGDKQQAMDAQDRSKPTGKIHRVNDDGTVPKDNPFVKRPGALPTIWSYGHRNPQGLAWDPATGKLWESEHGPNGGDEINVIEPGRNYGWGVITMGTEPGMTKRSEPGMEQPIVDYTPTIAPTGMTFYSGDKYPGWKNSLFVSALAGQQLRRLETSGATVLHQEPVFTEFGRVRDVAVGPDGYLYVLLQRPGQVVSQSTSGMLARLVPVQQAEAPPMRIYIRSGLKTHGAGQHDYPQYLADWSKLLTERGAIVDGSLHFPTAAEIAKTDVIVMYKGDAAAMTPEEKATLEAYLKRGGGLVSFHDTLCGPDPDYFSTIVGGAKKHGQLNYTLEADIPYTIVDTAHPIMAGMSNFTIKDEAFFLITWAKSPAIKVLATATMAATPSAKGHEGELVPQIWTYERSLDGGQPYRAFVWMQGHNYSNFADPRIQPMLLRGIAWAAKRSVESLMTVPPPRARGGA